VKWVVTRCAPHQCTWRLAVPLLIYPITSIHLSKSTKCHFDQLQYNQVSRFPSEAKLLWQQHYLIIIPEDAVLIHPIAPHLKAGLKVPYVGPDLAAYDSSHTKTLGHESDAWWRKASLCIHFFLCHTDWLSHWMAHERLHWDCPFKTVHPGGFQTFILLGSQRSQCILQLCWSLVV
jgi:hypothetical protein